MRPLLYLAITCTILFTSCTNDVAGTAGVFTNPLDPETAAEIGFLTPAVVFFPATASTSVGSGVTLDIHAMDVDSIAGSRIQDDTALRQHHASRVPMVVGMVAGRSQQM